jgi:hypothetical protein
MENQSQTQYQSQETKQNDLFIKWSPVDTFTINYFNVGIRLVTLPLEFRTNQKLIDLIENKLFIGKVSAIKIFEHVSQNGLKYYSAIIDMENWFISNNTWQLLNKLTIQNQYEQQCRFDLENRVNIDIDSEGVWFPISWENGKPMTHLTVQLVKEGSAGSLVNIFNSQRLKLADDEWNSLHIPIIPNGMRLQLRNGEIININQETMAGFIEDKLRLGKVKRIDFVDRDDIENKPKAAFIHFEYWCDNKNVSYLRNKLNKEGQFRQIGHYDGFDMKKFEVYNTETAKYKNAYFVFKINHKPIPEIVDCDLNIHQLVAIKNKLESQVDEMTKELEKLRSKCQEYDTFIDSNKLREQFEKNDDDDEKCPVCNGTGISYWSDDIYGNCLECCCINCGKEKCNCEVSGEIYLQDEDEEEMRRMQEDEEEDEMRRMKQEEEDERLTMLEEYAEEQEFRKMLRKNLKKVKKAQELKIKKEQEDENI